MPFPRSVGGAPGLCHRHQQMPGPRCPPSHRRRGAGRRPPPRQGLGGPPGAPPLRPPVRRGKVAAAATAPPPPPSRFPPRLTRGGGEPALGAPAAAPARPAGTQAGERRVRDGPGVVAGRVPSHSLAGPPRGRIAFKTSPSPPPGPGRGRARGGAGTPSCAPGAGPPPLSLSEVPQLSPVPNSALTFSFLVPTLPGPQTEPDFPLRDLDLGPARFSAKALPGSGESRGPNTQCTPKPFLA